MTVFIVALGHALGFLVVANALIAALAVWFLAGWFLIPRRTDYADD